MSSHLRCLDSTGCAEPSLPALPVLGLKSCLPSGWLPRASRGRHLACSSGAQASAPHLHHCALRPADLAELQNLLHFLLPTVFAAQGFEDLAEMLQVWAQPVGQGQCHALAVAGHSDVHTMS